MADALNANVPGSGSAQGGPACRVKIRRQLNPNRCNKYVTVAWVTSAPYSRQGLRSRPKARSCSVAANARGRLYNLNSKLNVVVRIDLDHSKALVMAKGHITIHSVNALYVVVKRANSLKEGLDVKLDISQAWVDDEALEMLHTASETHHLPAKIDPKQAPCTISVLAPRREHTPARPALIAA
jgi:hypothetical protein